MVKEKSVRQFDRDVLRNKGYLYTQTDQLSSRLANRRWQKAFRELVDLKGKRVLDLGCGDGTYTLEFLKEKPAFLMGVDASKMAVRAAAKKVKGNRKIRFKALDIYKAGSLGGKFDVVILRGVLHHLYDPEKAIAVVSKIAPQVVVIEPNGFNPVLKLLEKFSKYHVEHEERSFFPPVLEGWFKKQGGGIEKSFYAGLVPFFCPDWMARILKVLEPVVEKIPIVRHLSCAVYAFSFSRS